MQKIWNELAHQPVAKAVQNFRKRVKACANKAGEHFEHFIWHIQYRFSDHHLASKQLFTGNLSARLFF